MELKAIGKVKSPFKIKNGSSHQGRFSEELSTIIVFPEFAEALEGIENFTNLIVIYWLDRSGPAALKVVPHGRKEKRGLFTTRAPVRPNPLALCMVELVKVEGNILTVKWLDALDKSLVLDIKPFVPTIDCP